MFIAGVLGRNLFCSLRTSIQRPLVRLLDAGFDPIFSRELIETGAHVLGQVSERASAVSRGMGTPVQPAKLDGYASLLSTRRPALEIRRGQIIVGDLSLLNLCAHFLLIRHSPIRLYTRAKFP